MIVIGEKINGAIPSMASAIQNRDEARIQEIAVAQSEAGADYLDICAGSEPEKEYDTLCWLLDTVQPVSEVPICIDSPDPRMLLRILPRIQRPGIINSVSGEGDKCELLFPFLRDHADWKVIALTCDNSGIPSEPEKKVEIACRLIEKAAAYNIAPERILIDPLVLSLSAVGDAMLTFMEAIRQIKARYPQVGYTSGLSNISYGMPARKLVNQNFLTLAMSVGMNSAIMDPLDRGMRETVMAAEALLGRDRYCRNYNKAYRKGLIGPVKK
ncbi:MAG: methyltetrahydrofolate cobalamin methyltransferase [Oscillospiraceae bacterium]|nr:methyltetrahydrofolate cobalamin methyltransferase [Oscillospiraceae bacterium]